MDKKWEVRYLGSPPLERGSPQEVLGEPMAVSGGSWRKLGCKSERESSEQVFKIRLRRPETCSRG